MRAAIKRIDEEVPRGVCGGLEVPPARWAWSYHAHLVWLATLAILPLPNLQLRSVTVNKRLAKECHGSSRRTTGDRSGIRETRQEKDRQAHYFPVDSTSNTLVEKMMAIEPLRALLGSSVHDALNPTERAGFSFSDIHV